MDSPVIVDTASKFGRGIDVDRSFPGFPFDDDGFGRRSDIRAHLDDLASRHPEFADHLLGPPWGDIPFHGGNSRDRRRGSGSVSSHQNYPEDDTRSQASGSSAASGASAVSSHSEPDHHKSSSPQDQHREGFKNNIPQHGLRNTVDIGQQHRQNMDNTDKGLRGQRSMSAPPENRQPVNQDQQPSAQGQRYVSRVDITPQNNQQSKPQQQPQQQPQSNVRHIPIFVEGRDEPVLPKVAADEQPSQHNFQRQPSPPHFQRPSHYNQQYGARPQQWPPQYQDPFFQTRFPDPFESRRTHSPGYQRSPQRSEQYFESPQRQQKSEQQRHPPQQHTSKQQQHQQQQQQQESQEPPKPKVPPPLPKDPLEKVAMVQKEVDSLAEQVKEYSGNSRKDKQYIYLDEMLTRELIKLDDIETEGRENVRQARKNAIKCIQNTISLLESKAPLPGQTPKPEEEKEVPKNEEGIQGEEKMEVQRQTTPVETMEEEQSNGPIPLPPAPSSPVKKEQENEQQQQQQQLPPANKEDSTIDVHSNAEEKTQQSNENHSEKQETQQMEVEKPPSNKSPKKVKKSKKQKPISETPIPLPPPENIEENK